METANAFKEKGNENFVSGNYQMAIEFYTKAIKAHPESSFHANRAACYLQLKKFHAATEDCKKAIELDPKSIKPYYRLAQAHSAVGELKLAFEALRLGVQQNPQELNMRREYDNIQILMSYKDQIEPLIDTQQFAEALKKVSAILEKCEMDFDLIVRKIELLCKINDPKTAKTLLREKAAYISTVSAPKFAILTAMIERYTNKLDEAKKILQQAQLKFPDNLDIKKELKHLLSMEFSKGKGNSAFSQKKFKEAIAFYDDCFLLDPYNSLWKAVLLSNKASCYMGLKDTKMALDLMKHATEFDPKNAKNWYKRGKLEKDLKEWESAMTSMKQAKSIDAALTIDADIKFISEQLKKSENKDYYRILGVPKTATDADIRKAYKKMVRLHHPDRHAANSEEQTKAMKIFKDVNEANQILCDPKKRQEYDLGGFDRQEGGARPTAFARGFGSDPRAHFSSNFEGMEPAELFGMFFSNPSGGNFGFSSFGSQTSSRAQGTQGHKSSFKMG